MKKMITKEIDKFKRRQKVWIKTNLLKIIMRIRWFQKLKMFSVNLKKWKVILKMIKKREKFQTSFDSKFENTVTNIYENQSDFSMKSVYIDELTQHWLILLSHPLNEQIFVSFVAVVNKKTFGKIYFRF